MRTFVSFKDSSRYRLLQQETQRTLLWAQICGNQRQYSKPKARVKIDISEELSKSVIKPIKFFEISGQWDMLFFHLGNVRTCKSSKIHGRQQKSHKDRWLEWKEHSCICMSVLCEWVCHSVFGKEHPSRHTHTLTETAACTQWRVPSLGTLTKPPESRPVFKILFHAPTWSHGDRGLLNPI